MQYRIAFDQRQFDTVLAALRGYQLAHRHPRMVSLIAAGEHNQPLTDYEIHDLCEYINPSDPEAHFRALADNLVEPIPLADR